MGGMAVRTTNAMFHLCLDLIQFDMTTFVVVLCSLMSILMAKRIQAHPARKKADFDARCGAERELPA